MRFGEVKGRVNLKCHLPADDLDHCLIRKNKKFKDYINGLEWNYQPSCKLCNRHTHAADKLDNRRWWFEVVLDEYGMERIKADLEAAPEKLKNTPHNDWNEVWGWVLDA